MLPTQSARFSYQGLKQTNPEETSFPFPVPCVRVYLVGVEDSRDNTENVVEVPR